MVSSIFAAECRSIWCKPTAAIAVTGPPRPKYPTDMLGRWRLASSPLGGASPLPRSLPFFFTPPADTRPALLSTTCCRMPGELALTPDPRGARGRNQTGSFLIDGGIPKRELYNIIPPWNHAAFAVVAFRPWARAARRRMLAPWHHSLTNQDHFEGNL